MTDDLLARIRALRDEQHSVGAYLVGRFESDPDLSPDVRVQIERWNWAQAQIAEAVRELDARGAE